MADLTDRQADLLARALGWPDTYQIRRRRGVMWKEWLRRMREPYRNYYLASEAVVLDWRGMMRDGLAARQLEPGDYPRERYLVTPAGMAACRAHLLRVRAEARRG